MAQPLSNEQVADYRKRLRAAHAELLEQVRQALLQSDDEHYAELAGTVHDLGEEAVADLLSDLAIDGIDRHVREIGRIEDALGRIANGAYGVCVDCGRAIEPQRLDVHLTAQRCYPCQRQYERTHGPAGGSTL